MVKQRRFGNLSLRSPLGLWLLAGATAVVLAALVVTFSARTVQADAPLPKPVAVAPPPAPPVAEATPTQLTPPAPRQSFIKRRFGKLHGIASWYGTVFHGRKTASGERFNMHEFTACHPTLPFGSLVRVKNLDNERTVVVRITDRSGLMANRIIDLSYGAAQELAMTSSGLAKVELKVLSLGESQDQK
jgi:rare lipoprotein A